MISTLEKPLRSTFTPLIDRQSFHYWLFPGSPDRKCQVGRNLLDWKLKKSIAGMFHIKGFHMFACAGVPAGNHVPAMLQARNARAYA